MLISFAELLEERDATAAPVGGFTCYTLETIAGVLRAAEDLQSPVMLLISAQAFRSHLGRWLVNAMRAGGEAAQVPVCLQLDHVDDLDLMQRALDAGVGAVMADGSKLSFEDNVHLSRRARELARRHGAHVEVELGRIEGDEEVARATRASGLTDLAEAVEFVERVRPACLAVSIGNVHGRYAAAPQLEWDLLREIERRVEIPLSLHGGSGLPRADIARSIEMGIRKINVNTELRARHLEVVSERLPAVREGAQLLTLATAVTDAVAGLVEAKLREFDPSLTP